MTGGQGRAGRGPFSADDRTFQNDFGSTCLQGIEDDYGGSSIQPRFEISGEGSNPLDACRLDSTAQISGQCDDSISLISRKSQESGMWQAALTLRMDFICFLHCSEYIQFPPRQKRKHLCPVED